MKRILLVTACLTALFGLSACEQEDIGAFAEGSVSVSVRGSVPVGTKVSTAAETYEGQVNSLQLFVFDGNGDIVGYGRAGGPSATIEKVPVGIYTLAVVANNAADLSSTGSLEALRGTTMALGANSTTASAGFLMYGEKSGVAVKVSGTSESIVVTRFPARISLVSVTNGVTSGPKTLVVKAALLINGLGTWNYGAEGEAAGNVNPAGEKGERIMAAAADADEPDLTFSDLGNTPVTGTVSFNRRFYSFPKAAVDTDVFGSNVGGNVRLSVLATVNGKDYWYPVTIAGIDRNKCYDVSLTITGPGSSHPNTPVISGHVTASVSVSEWRLGAAYGEMI